MKKKRFLGYIDRTHTAIMSRQPSAWRLDFLAKKFLGFLTFLAKILASILGKVRKILQKFSRSRKEIQEN